MSLRRPGQDADRKHELMALWCPVEGYLTFMFIIKLFCIQLNCVGLAN